MDNNDQSAITEIVFEAVLDNHAVKKAGKVTDIDPTMLLDDLKVDSLEKLALAMDFEDQFSIEITDEDIEGFVTVGDFITYLEKAVAESKNAPEEPVVEQLNEQSVEDLADSGVDTEVDSHA